MGNEFEAAVEKGFSRRAASEEFRDMMRKQVNKNFKYVLIAMPIVYIITAAIIFIVCAKNGSDTSVAVGSSLIVFIIIAVILIVNIARFIKNLGSLKKESIDGVIIKTKKSAETLNDGKHRTRYKIVIQTEDGAKIKVKNDKAAPYYSCLEKGDKVRYHPGFVFPIEIYDKSKKNVNVCAFCGTKNDASASECKRCRLPML